MSTLTLYADSCNPVCQSMQLYLSANNIQFNTVSDDVTAPSLHDNGKPVAGTYLDAVEYLRNGTGVNERQVEVFNAFMNNIKPLFVHTLITGNPREGLDLFFEALSYLENRLITSGGPYFGGKTPSMVDYGLYPWLEKVGSWIPPLTANECVKVQAWVKRMRVDPIVTKSMPSCDISSLDKYKNSLTTQAEKSL